MVDLNAVIADIKALQASVLTDMNAFTDKGNKAAGARARKNSIALEKKYKLFRKLSV